MIRRSHGFGLPETMISLFLASLIMAALMHQYISTKRHYAHLQKVLEDDTELQLATEFIRDRIRQAGFTPCLSLHYLTDIKAIQIDAQPKPSLRIHRMSSYFNQILDVPNPTQLLLTRESLLYAEKPILIADCYHAEIQTVSDVSQTVSGQLVTLSKPLAFSYKTPIYAGEWLDELFFISSKGGLFYQENHAEELTPLVKTMTLKLDSNPERTFVSVSFGLKNSHTLDFQTRVRAP